MRIEIVHGPNLNLLGQREPSLYGFTTLNEIDQRLHVVAQELAMDIATFQSNHEGALIDHLQACLQRADAFILNPAGYTHTSVALRDAILAIAKPTVEVHLSNPDAREGFRRTSLISDIVYARVAGFGPLGYELALRGVVAHLRQAK